MMDATLYDLIAELVAEQPDLADTITRATEAGLTQASERAALQQLAAVRELATPDEDDPAEQLREP